MSYCYDTMSKAWAMLENALPENVKAGEVAMLFGFLIEEMHEANHRLKDAINHDKLVTRCAHALDQACRKEIPNDNE
jgi:hypothetical protein